MKRYIYMDYAAATPMKQEVYEVMKPYLFDKFYNPSAVYNPARQVKKDIDAFRKSIAQVLGCKADEIIFTAGGTEANNLAIRGLLDSFPGSQAVVSDIEHDSILNSGSKDEEIITVPVDAEARVDIDKLYDGITKKTVVVSVMLANNEVGTIQPVKQIATIIDKVRKDREKSGNPKPIYLHTDATQAAAYLPIDVNRLGVDMMTLNAGKIYGPKQVGCLYISSSVNLTAQIKGGGQEKGLRSGTENVAGIAGFAKALEVVQAKRSQESQRLQRLKNNLIKQLLEIEGAVINTPEGKSLPGNINASFEDVDGEDLVLYLEKHGFLAATGSACAASKQEPSHVLLAMGLSMEQASSSLRLTLGDKSTQEHIDKLMGVLPDLVEKLRSR